MSQTITVSQWARWEIDNDGNPTFHLHRRNGEVHSSQGPIPWTEKQVGDLIVHMLRAGLATATEDDVMHYGAEMVGYPLGGKTWQKPAPFRVRDAIEGLAAAPVDARYVYEARLGYVVRHRYGRWLALDADLNLVPLPGALNHDTRSEALYPTREEAVHRVTANYQPADRNQAIIQADALYEEAGRIYNHIELLQTLLREEGRTEEADTLELPLARAFKALERRQSAMSAL